MNIDNWLFDKVFQPFADYFQRMVGRNNFFLAFCCSTIAALLKFDNDTNHKFGFTNYFLDCVIFVSGMTASMYAQSQYSKRSSNSDIRALNSLRIDYMQKTWRHVWLGVLATNTIFLLIGVLTEENLNKLLSTFIMEIFGIALLSYLYFIACTPLPPQKSKVFEMTSSLVSKSLAKLKDSIPKPSGELPAPAPT